MIGPGLLQRVRVVPFPYQRCSETRSGRNPRPLRSFHAVKEYPFELHIVRSHVAHTDPR